MTTTAQLELIAPGVHRVFSHAGVPLVQQMREQVAALDGDPGDLGRCADIGRVDQLRALEELKASIAAAEARITREFERSQLAQQDDAVRRERELGNTARAERLEAARGRGIGDQVALARNDSTSRGARHLAFARAMAAMPHTLDLLTRGQVSEWVATLLVRETEVLSREDRSEVDRRLCAMTVDGKTGEVHDPAVLGMSPHRVEGRARALAAELDADAAVRRAAKSQARRRVTIRATPTTMTHVTGLLPVKDGVAVFASLQVAARAAKAAGDERTEPQLMADLMVQRITGHPACGNPPPRPPATDEPGATPGASPSSASDSSPGASPGTTASSAYDSLPVATPGATPGPTPGSASDESSGSWTQPGRRPEPGTPGDSGSPPGPRKVADSNIPIEVHLVMTADTFTGDSDQPARTADGTVVPAGVARAWLRDPGTPVTLRRLFTDPLTGQSTGVDPRRRRHSKADQAFLRVRDQTCRMPGCDRPIADIDHPVRHADGGESTRVNGQGLCEGHNLAKEAPGWRTRVSDPRPGHHEVEIVTPTGHVYRSKAPPAMPPPL